jgi:hypothetical protein
MPDTEPMGVPRVVVLDPNKQLRWAIEHLPSPTASKEQIARVEAPSEDAGGSPVVVEFRRATRTHEGRAIEGWVFEGPITIAATDLSVEAGFPGVESWVRGKLGPFCVELKVGEPVGTMALARVFATTKDQL